jgi:DNA-binding NarL/FixJ family response regulator
MTSGLSGTPSGMARPRMLVCEDAIGYRMLIRRWLEDADVDVVGEASTWLEAVDMAAELHPDAVVADLWMPTLDTDALQRLRTAAPNAAIVSLSGLSAEDAERLVGDAGVIDLFLSKRQPPAEIVESLRTFVRERLPANGS